MADASSLIHSAKVPRLWTLLKETFEAIYIPEAVYREILRGTEIQSPDVPVIEEAISKGWIKIAKIEEQPRLPESLGPGEREAIALMEQMKLDWLLLDDCIASMTARFRGLHIRSIAYILIYLKRKSVISQAQATELLDNLVETSYHLSSKDYVAIKELIVST